jgi:hypothetical protein
VDPSPVPAGRTSAYLSIPSLSHTNITLLPCSGIQVTEWKRGHIYLYCVVRFPFLFFFSVLGF